MGTELTVKDAKRSIQTMMDDRAEHFAQIAAKGVDPVRARKQAATAIFQNADLMACTPASLCVSVAQAVELGLDLAKARGEAYLVPYKSTCQLIVGYQGWIKLAIESGLVLSIDAQVVYEGEEFEARLGTDFYIHHTPSFKGGDIAGAYAVATLAGGHKVPLILREADVARARAASRAKTGPWVTDTAAMVRKTAVLRLMKLLPKSPVLGKALEYDADSRYDQQPSPPPTRPRNVREILGTADKSPDDYDQTGGSDEGPPPGMELGKDEDGFLKSIGMDAGATALPSADPKTTTEPSKGADASGGILPGMAGKGRKA